MVTLGVTWMLRITYRYRGSFQSSRIGDLIQDTVVSQMRPRAVELRGRSVGNGVPGALWIPDLVLKDESGMVFVLYRSSIPFARLFFVLNDADRFHWRTGDTAGMVPPWFAALCGDIEANSHCDSRRRGIGTDKFVRRVVEECDADARDTHTAVILAVDSVCFGGDGDGGRDHLVAVTLRLPRTLRGLGRRRRG